ncbi:rhomboid family protein [Sunxiuqinia elliptica]|uniref:Membrane associated rhomboid family serine protease n=1 Tax=Sunxiuqinia elliptica TaxID=655355 RepID=A0A4R6HBH4_9BACT|nr:rhomboid family intramembrane serine protease [Sunxiuqinia elliptica]TDO05091.1 membrane associated rhomboid family serine protease [Sunxiuqinia elliptica]TDO64640.1 membrane associated rhomboid family serine protease [Sunxiuqinia elliptica]
MSILDEIKESFKKGSALTRLIYINIGVFLVIRIINVFFFLLNQDFSLISWLALPADISQLAYKPWTLITYMFLHFDFLHILFNILWLYWLGKLFLFYFNEKQLIGVYLLGGIVGGIFFLAAYNLFPAFANQVPFSQLLGASASVIAIVIAVAMWAPNHTINLLFVGPIKMKYIALVAVAMYVIGIASSNAGGNLAHIGGAAFGLLFVLQYRKNNDLTKGVSSLLDKGAKLFKPKQKIKITYKGKASDDIEYNRQQNLKQEEVNRVLEKISKSGYDSLTKEEKELLFKMGK